MILDKKGKLYGKVSIIDICVVLVVIVGVLGAYFATSLIKGDNSNEKKGQIEDFESLPTVSASITLEVKGVRHMTRDGFNVGDEIYHTMSDTLIGTISKVTSKPSEKMYIADDGSFYEAVVPEKYDVEVVVDVLGKQTKTGFKTVDELPLLYGSSIEIKTTSIKTLPEITGVEITSSGEQE